MTAGIDDVAIYIPRLYLDAADFADELAQGAPGFTGTFRSGWIFFIKWICPIVIILLILNMVGLFGAPQAA